MIRKKRMSKGIAKILSGLLVFGMVAGLVPAVPGGAGPPAAGVHRRQCDGDRLPDGIQLLQQLHPDLQESGGRDAGQVSGALSGRKI